MNDDDLRHRIAAADPAPGEASIEPVRSASAQHLLEAIMTTDLDTPTTAPASGGDDTSTGGRRRTRWTMAVAGVAAAAVVALGAAALGGAFERDVAPDIAVEEPPSDGLPVDESPDDTPAEGAVLELTAGTPDMMASCIRPDATVAGMSETAFLGTVTSIDGGLVTLTVDRWYVGGEAPVVTVLAPDGLEALTGSVDFVVGEQFVISSYDDTVAYCELSGPATPERVGWYEQAFGA